MAPNKSKPTSIKEISRTSLGFFEATKALKEAAAGGDHAGDRLTAIVGGAIVETALSAGLGRIMRDDLGPAEKTKLKDGLFKMEGGILASMGSRIDIAYAFGIIGPITRRDLVNIGKIRNAFAHSIAEIHFGTPSVKDLCAELKLPTYEHFRKPPRDAREAFVTTVAVTQGWLQLTVKLTAPRIETSSGRALPSDLSDLKWAPMP
ncbi:hypothetical protein AB7828_26095 [Tardiphaga sp. 215_C5_N2_1]|uniref:hypothetical protein n=1 Tax=Tardiphaga sp. 215_C5_N2_1 TaxID=3240774 RepID=UPI003F89D052